MTIILTAAMPPGEPPLLQLREAEAVARFKDYPEWQVREESFLAEVRFSIGELVLSRRREPILDFGLSLRSILDTLLLTGSAELAFQGSTDRIRFALTEDRVEVRANYAKGVASCPYVDIRRAGLVFMRDALNVLTEVAPGLLKNDFIEYLFRDSLVREMGDEQFRRHSAVMAEKHRQG